MAKKKMKLLARISDYLFGNRPAAAAIPRENAENTNSGDSNLLEFECVSPEELGKNREEISKALFDSHRRRDLEEEMSLFATFNCIGCFRDVARTSYNPAEFQETMPQELRFFVDRGNTLEKGRELDYHEERRAHVNNLVDEVDRNPARLREIEAFVYRFFIDNIIVGQGDMKTKSNALLQFKVLAADAQDIYSLLCLRRFGKDKYVIGVGEDNRFRVRNAPKSRTDAERINYYSAVHSHAIVFMTMDPEILGQLVPHEAKWAKSGNRFEGLGRPGAGMLGFEMLRAGQENKYFHSSEPHEIIVNDPSIRRMTVIDVPPDAIYYSTKFVDGSMSVGAMITEENGGRALNSDLISTCIMNPGFYTDECYVLLDLAGSIARDMFVCEQRDKFYQIEGPRAPSEGGRGNQNRITWLPRFKINLRRPIGPEQLREYTIRLSPSHVSGHPRKCDNPSERQINLARSLGINLPPGSTYVKEHNRRESKEFSRLYKSRSAMSLIYEVR